MTANLQEKRWETLAFSIEKIQSLAFKAHENNTEDLLYYLSSLELPFPEGSLSILYRPYGEVNLKVLVYKGRALKRSKSILTPKRYDQVSLIQKISDNVTVEQQVQHLDSKKKCLKEGIRSADSALICPIRFSSRKNLGVFIVSAKKAEGSLAEYSKILHIFSDRIAYYIRHNIRKRRNHHFQKAQNKLLSRDFLTGEGIFNAYLDEMSKWFDKDEIHLLLKPPLETTKFVVATKNKKIVKEWRNKTPQSIENLSDYLRQDVELTGEIARMEFTCNSSEEIKKLGITGGYASYAIAPLQLKNKVILGYVVITNSTAEEAFEYDEDQSIDVFSDFVAQLIGTYRDDVFQESQRAIREFDLEDRDNHQENLKALYRQVKNDLSHLYGVKELAILRYTQSSLGLTLEDIDNPLKPLLSSTTEEGQQESVVSTGDKRFYRDTNDYGRQYYSTLHEALLEIVVSSHTQNRPKSPLTDEAVKVNIREFVICDIESGKYYFVSPMRTKTHSVGCLVFPAEHIGSHTALNIDDLSDTLGIKLDGYGRWKRYILLNKFSKVIAQLENHSTDYVIKQAEKFISQAMYTRNLYIALYDKSTQIISFPLALKDGRLWTKTEGFEESIHGSERKLNKFKQGKTEYILLNSKKEDYLLHRTKLEAANWYNQPGREDFAKDNLASWVGVPIFSRDGVAGVIATYHDKLDYIFSERDVFFLQQIAASVSSMLQTLVLKESEKKNNEISNTIDQLQEKSRQLAFKEIDEVTETLVDVLLATKATNQSIQRAVVENDIEIIKSGLSISTGKNTTNILKDSINKIESLQKIRNKQPELIELDPLIRESYNNTSQDFSKDRTNIRLKRDGEGSVKTIILKQDFEIILYAIFSGFFSSLSHADKYLLRYKVSETSGNILICFHIFPCAEEDVNSIVNDSNIRASMQLANIKLNGDIVFENKNISESKELILKFKFPNNRKTKGISIVNIKSDLEGALRSQLEFIFIEEQLNFYDGESSEALIVITEDVDFARDMANFEKDVYLISSDGDSKNMVDFNAKVLSKTKIAIDEKPYEYLKNTFTG